MELRFVFFVANGSAQSLTQRAFDAHLLIFGRVLYVLLNLIHIEILLHPEYFLDEFLGGCIVRSLQIERYYLLAFWEGLD